MDNDHKVASAGKARVGKTGEQLAGNICHADGQIQTKIHRHYEQCKASECTVNTFPV